MANEFAHDKMCTLFEEVAETTGMKMSLSKSLQKYEMGGDANSDRAASQSDNSNDNGADREYIPQDYRFDVTNGIESTPGDGQDIIDRMIPVNRDQARHIKASIDAKGLRDPQRRSKVAQGFARDLANAIDSFCYQRMIDQSTMVIRNTGDFSYQQAIDAEVLMLNYGLGAFDKKLFLSNRDYARVAKDLGQNQYYGRDGVPNDALTKATVPPLATFDTMRSDYLINLAGNTSTGLTVNGDQEHTVSTYDSSDNFYLDNRFMTLAITGATPTTMPVGTKFTIAGVDYVHPETRVPSGELLTLTVKETGTGSVTCTAIVASGPDRNASAAAADGAAITILNTSDSAPSLFYTPESTQLIPGRLPVPADAGGVRSVEATTAQSLPMRMTYWYDGDLERFRMKALVFFDCQVVYPNQVGAILSNQS